MEIKKFSNQILSKEEKLKQNYVETKVFKLEFHRYHITNSTLSRFISTPRRSFHA